MPIYEYQCSQCSHQFEMIHGAFDRDLKILCPKCGASKSQRVISTFSCGGPRGIDAGSASGCSSRPGRFT